MFPLALGSAGLALLMTGTMTGVFFAFSTSVMTGLDAIKPDQAIYAMQSMNQKIQNPLFIATFLLAPVAGLAAGALLLALDQKLAGLLFLLAAGVYILGALFPSFGINIPMNNTLDAVHVPTSLDDAARIWSDYSGRWTRWNNLRGVSSLVSLLLIGAGTYLWATRR